MEIIVIKASRRVYSVFTVIFGGIGLIFFILLSSKNGISEGITFSLPFFTVLLFTYVVLSIYKISYDNNQIKYRGLFGTKIVNIKDIKRYKIKAEIHTISTKPIFGLFKITINNPIKPMFGLAIDTISKKSEIIIPAKLFLSEDLNNFMKHINIVNGSPKGKPNAGKSVFKYRKKK